MSRPDLILLHPPSIFRFRDLPIFYGPISDVIPSSSLFELYPIGFLSISEYLHRHGISIRIVNMAIKGALELLDIKVRYGIIEKKLAEEIKDRVRESIKVIEEIDSAVTGSQSIDNALKSEIFRLNTLTSICDKDELKWPIQARRLKPLKIMRSFLKKP